MRFLFDASSILEMIRGFEEEATLRILSKNAVLDLTKYEVGNALWKEYVLRHVIGKSEFQEFLSLLRGVILRTQAFSVKSEDLSEIAQVAAEERVTFYDASYIDVARAHGLTLITEDEVLMKAASKHTKTASVKEIRS